MPEKELTSAYLQWQLGLAGGVFLFLLALLVRGFKGYVEDIKKDTKDKLQKLEKKMETSVKKEYIKEEIKPELSKLNQQLMELLTLLGSLIGREEYHTDLRNLHEKIDRKADKNHDG